MDVGIPGTAKGVAVRVGKGACAIGLAGGATGVALSDASLVSNRGAVATACGNPRFASGAGARNLCMLANVIGRSACLCCFSRAGNNGLISAIPRKTALSFRKSVVGPSRGGAIRVGVGGPMGVMSAAGSTCVGLGAATNDLLKRDPNGDFTMAHKKSGSGVAKVGFRGARL